MLIFSSLLTVLQIVSAVAIIVLVLLQHGKGADMGSGFGGGAASLFGASGSANFLSRMTKWAAIVFFSATAGMAYVTTRKPTATPDLGIMESATGAAVDKTVPRAPAAVPAAQTGAAVPAAPVKSVPSTVPTPASS